MKRKIFKSLLALGPIWIVGIGFLGCPLVTLQENWYWYQVDDKVTEPAYKETRKQGYWTWVSFRKPRSTKWVIPAFYEIQTYGAPNRYWISIHGPFEKVEKVKVTIFKDDIESMSFSPDPQDLEYKMRKNKAGEKTTDIHSFAIKDESGEPIPDKYKFHIEWSALYDGEMKTFSQIRGFKIKVAPPEHGNLWLWGLEGV